jgi:hypothetical protein
MAAGTAWATTWTAQASSLSSTVSLQDARVVQPDRGAVPWCAVRCSAVPCWELDSLPAAGWCGVGDAGVRMLEPVGDGAVASRSHSGRSDESESEGLRRACRRAVRVRVWCATRSGGGMRACGYGGVVVLSALELGRQGRQAVVAAVDVELPNVPVLGDGLCNNAGDNGPDTQRGECRSGRTGGRRV